MRFSLQRLIRSFDDFGHPITLTYKGEETYQSCLGGLLTFFVSAFTLAMAATKIQSVVQMSDPIVTSFSRPLTLAMREDLGALSFKDHHFNIGYVVVIDDDHPGQFPPEVGKIVAKNGGSTLQTKPCDQVLPPDVAVRDAEEIQCIDLTAEKDVFLDDYLDENYAITKGLELTFQFCDSSIVLLQNDFVFLLGGFQVAQKAFNRLLVLN